MNSTLVYTTSTESHRRHATAVAGIARVHHSATLSPCGASADREPLQACTHPRELVVTGEAGNRQCVECRATP